MIGLSRLDKRANGFSYISFMPCCGQHTVLAEKNHTGIAISARVIDAKSDNTMTIGQAIILYLAYYLSGAALGLGLFWIEFDRRKTRLAG